MVTVEVPGQQRYVRELYWYPDRQAFWDNIREEMSETYNILSYDGKRLDNSNWDKTSSVVAWKKREKTYMTGFVPNDFWKSHFNEKYKKGGKYERRSSFKNKR